MLLEHSIQIDAPPSVVWRVTEDVESWPQWTPTVESIARVDSGPLEVGSTARIKQPGLPSTDWVVTELTHGERFAWQSRVRGIRLKAIHEITAIGAGTQVVLRLEVSGAVAVLLWPVIRSAALRALEQENAGLKARCENLHSS